MTSNISYSFNPSQLLVIKQNIFSELQQAAAGVTNSLTFARHELKGNSIQNGSVQLLVIGGTNSQSAIASIQNNMITLSRIKQVKQPVFDSDTTLFNFIFDIIDTSQNLLAINFAYPLQPVNSENLDGILLKPTKEHVFSNLIGKQVGKSLNQYIFSKHKSNPTIRLANDTICLVLSAAYAFPDQNVFAGVIGTGFNFGIKHHNSFVNLELGNFNNFKSTDSGQFIDSTSKNPSHQLFEKEISGAYLHEHFNYYAKQIDIATVESAIDVSSLSKNKNKAGKLALGIINRSAALAAAAIAAIAEFTDSINNTVIIEGSLFWECNEYHNLCRQHLSELCKKTIRISKTKKSSLYGAASLFL